MLPRITAHHSSQTNKSKFKCSVCTSGDHRIASCPKFSEMDINKRYAQVKELKLCFAYLSSTHSRNECQSVYQCKHCSSRNHHSLLHPTDSSNNHPQKSNSQPSCWNTNNQPHLSSFPGTGQNASSSSTVPASQNLFSGNHAIQFPSASSSVVLLGTAVVQV